MSRRVELICDICNLKIDDGAQVHVDAAVYGVDSHLNCFLNLSALDVLLFLSIDDIRFAGEKSTRSTLECYRK